MKPRLRRASLGKQRALFNFNLLRQKQGARFVRMPLEMKFNFIRNARRKPRAADDPYFAARERKFRNVGGETDIVVDVRVFHEDLHALAMVPVNFLRYPKRLMPLRGQGPFFHPRDALTEA